MKLVPTLSREETYLLCQSGARKEKEKAIRNPWTGCLRAWEKKSAAKK